MPYIKHLRTELLPKSTIPAGTAGELNYQITKLCKAYRENDGNGYQTFNDIIGALEAAKLEFYRRMVVPYEDIKITENGDVY
jgi:hypothetical protein